MRSILATIVDALRNEPAVVISALTALIGLGVTLGFVQDEQAKAIVGTLSVVVPMLGSLLIRSQVTPTAAPRHAAPDA